MLNAERLRRWTSGDVRHVYTERDTILYALGVGLASDPLDRAQLRFVDERALSVLPSMASVLASPGSWMRHSDFGIDYTKIVHGEQRIELHAELPAAGSIIGRSHVLDIDDKGPGRGAVLQVRKHLFDAGTMQPLATVDQSLFCRGNGGFSGAARPAMDAEPRVAEEALRPAPPLDDVVIIPTRTDAALLYRLSGDLNPLHLDPDVARGAGFERPILHGLASFGIVCHAVLARYCDHDPGRLRTLQARFAAPVYPGEHLRMLFRRDQEQIAFEVQVVERDVTVLRQGQAVLSPQ